MKTLEGKLVRVDMGAGGWALEMSRGRTVELFGDIPAKLDGQQVEVVGKPVEGFSTTMIGSSQALEVERIRVR